MKARNIDPFDTDTIKYSKVKNILEKIKSTLNQEDPDIPVTYFLSAFFPNAINNIKEQITKSYMEGYKDGKNSLMEDDGK